MALPKISNHHIIAAHQTFVKPITDSIKWRVGQLAPKQIAYNILASNGIGQAALDYKFNYDFAKNPFMGGFFNQAGLGPPPGTPMQTTNIGQTGGDSNGVVRVITESFTNGFTKMVQELKTIRMSILQLARVSSIGADSSNKNANKLTELVELFKNVFTRNKFADAEANLERGNAGQTDVTSTSETSKSMASKVVDSVFSGIWNFLKSKTAWIAGAAILMRDRIFDSIKFVMTKLVDGIKGIKFGDGFKKLIEPFAKVFKGIFSFLEDAGKHMAPILKLLPEMKGLAKSIPIVGQAIALILAVFDGVKGFIEEFKEADGSLINKITAGFGGALKGIIKGILEIPKAIVLGIKWITEQVLAVFGFKEASKALKDFKLGEKIDSFIDNIFKVLVKTFKPDSKLVDNLGQFVVRAFKGIIAVMFPAVAPIINKLIPETRETKTLDDKAKDAEKVTSESTVANTPDNLRDDSNTTFFDNVKTVTNNFITRGREFIDAAAKRTESAAKVVLGNIGDNLKQGLEIPAKFYDSIRSHESSGKDNAKNPRSSASGRYQFTKDTWERLGYNWNDRFNVELQEQAVRRLTNANANALRNHGIAINGGSLYAAHFLGAGSGKAAWGSKGVGAIDVYSRTDDSTPMTALLSADVLNANPFLRKMNVGEFKRWAFKAGGGSFGTDGNPVANPKAGPQAVQLEKEVIDQAKRDARRNTPIPTVQQNISAPTVVNNNNAGRMPKPSTQAERFRQFNYDSRPRP